MNINLPLQGVD